MHAYLSALPLLAAVVTAGVSAFAITRNPRHPANIGLALGMAAVAAVEAGHALMTAYGGGRPLYMGLFISFAAEAFLPPAWLLFSLSFARANRGDMLRRWTAALAALFLAALLFSYLSPSLLSAPVPWPLAGDHTPGGAPLAISRTGRFFHIYLILGLILSLAQLENTLMSSEAAERRRIKHVIIGSGSMLAFFLYSSSQALLFSSVDVNIVPVISAVVLISSSIMALFIVRHRLMDSDVFISRYVVCNSVAALAAGAYLIAVGLISHGISYFGMPLDYLLATLFVFISILSLFFLLFSEYARRRLELFVVRHFYRHKYEFKDKWMESVERIGSRTDARGVVATVAAMLTASMGSGKILIWLYDNRREAFLCVHGSAPDGYASIGAGDPLTSLMTAATGPFTKDAMADKGTAALGLAAASGAELLAPLVANGDAVGFALLSGDVSSQPYGQDDIDLLMAVCAQAAIQIKNIWLTRDLMAAREYEVFHRMSSFVIHDLKNFTNSLSLIARNAQCHIKDPEFQRDMLKAVENTVSRMKGLIERLRKSPAGLCLNRKETDLRGLVRAAIGKLPPNRQKDIALRCETGFIPLIDIDQEAVETVLLNLITNAYEAIEDQGEIKVEASAEGGFAVVKVEDNGAGMPEEFIEGGLFRPFSSTKKNGLGIGLYQCKAIIEAHGGSIGVESAAGAGTCFTVRLPFRKKSMAV